MSSESKRITEAWRSHKREKALELAVEATTRSGQEPVASEIEAMGDSFYVWLTQARLALTVGPLTFEQGSSVSTPTKLSTSGGHPVATMTDNQQVPLSVQETDSKGAVVSDQLVWAFDDAGAVVAPQIADDTQSVLAVGVAPGVSNYTVTDSTNAALTGAGTITVTPSGATSLVVTEGAPVEQPGQTT